VTDEQIALEAAGIGLWSMDLATGVVSSSALNRDLFGLAEDATSADAWLAPIVAEDRPLVLDAWEAARLHAVPYAIEYRIRRHGETRWIETRGRFAVGADGAATRIVGVSQDVTARKRLEREREDELRRRTRFIATLAHELRNPLAPIRTSVAVLAVHPVDDPVVAHCRDVIARQMTHVTRLLDDLLDLSRLSRGLGHLRMTRLAVADPVQAAVEQARPLIEERGHALEVHLPETPLFVRGDHERVTQVLANLLANAAVHSPPQRSVTLAVEGDGAQARITVRDQGYGLSAEQLEDPLALGAQHHPSSGLGLGLALVRELVALHGGSVTADSAGPGQGTVIVVRLPLAPDEVSSAVSAPPGIEAPAAEPPA
jgi:PAS domain S-box-containing protein